MPATLIYLANSPLSLRLMADLTTSHAAPWTTDSGPLAAKFYGEEQPAVVVIDLSLPAWSAPFVGQAVESSEPNSRIDPEPIVIAIGSALQEDRWTLALEPPPDRQLPRGPHIRMGWRFDYRLQPACDASELVALIKFAHALRPRLTALARLQPTTTAQPGNSDRAIDGSLAEPSWSALPATLQGWLVDGAGDVYHRGLRYFDRLILTSALKHTDGNQAQAAKQLGLSRVTVRTKLRSLARVFVTEKTNRSDSPSVSL